MLCMKEQHQPQQLQLQQQQQQQVTIVGNEGPYGVFMNRNGAILLDGNQFDDIVVHHTSSPIDTNMLQYVSSTRDRYKTELCRSWEETGYCRYGEKCQFAHGAHEIREVTRHHKYKSELCNNYHYEGTCMYGIRCCFIHKVTPYDIGRAISQNIDVVPLKKQNRLRIFKLICDQQQQPQQQHQHQYQTIDPHCYYSPSIDYNTHHEPVLASATSMNSTHHIQQQQQHQQQQQLPQMYLYNSHDPTNYQFHHHPHTTYLLFEPILN